jgi:DNA modification methylase
VTYEQGQEGHFPAILAIWTKKTTVDTRGDAMTTQQAIQTLHGDCRELLDTLDAESVQAIVTSPPYWRMRRYTDDPREIGQEDTPAAYVAALAGVFAQCRRVLRTDGVLFLNLGDGYANDGKWGGSTGGKHAVGIHGAQGPARQKVTTGLPPKSLIGMPWRVAFALQDAGWILRTEIVWEKPNAMPESVTDRPTRSHEYVFLFAKSPRYYFDSMAIAEKALPRTITSSTFKRDGNKRSTALVPGNPSATHRPDRADTLPAETRNARTVWSIPTTGLADEHYAPMPQALAERCIRAGSKAGDMILDPFGGSGTTGRAAIALQRRATLIDLSYQDMQARRTDGVQVELFV